MVLLTEYRHGNSDLRNSVLPRNSTLYSVISYRINFGWIIIRHFYFDLISMEVEMFFRFWFEFRWSFLNMNWGHERHSRTDGFCVGIQTRSFYLNCGTWTYIITDIIDRQYQFSCFRILVSQLYICYFLPVLVLKAIDISFLLKLILFDAQRHDFGGMHQSWRFW